MAFVSKHCYNGTVDYYKHFFSISLDSHFDELTMSHLSFFLLIQDLFYLSLHEIHVYYPIPIQSDKWA